MEINLSAYQADVFLRTEELYSTQGYRNVPLFEDEYRLSKATAEYIKNNIPTSGGSVNNDAVQTYNAVLGITLAGTSSNTGALPDRVDETGNGTPNQNGNGTTNQTGGTTDSVTALGVFAFEQDLIDPTIVGSKSTFTFDYSGGINVGTQLLPIAPQVAVPTGYYLIQSTTQVGSIYNNGQYAIQVGAGDTIVDVINTLTINSGGGGFPGQL